MPPALPPALGCARVEAPARFAPVLSRLCDPDDPGRGRLPAGAAPRRAPAGRARGPREAPRPGRPEPALRPDRHAAGRPPLELRLPARDEPGHRRSGRDRDPLRPADVPVLLDEVLDGLALDRAL